MPEGSTGSLLEVGTQTYKSLLSHTHKKGVINIPRRGIKSSLGLMTGQCSRRKGG